MVEWKKHAYARMCFVFVVSVSLFLFHQLSAIVGIVRSMLLFALCQLALVVLCVRRTLASTKLKIILLECSS